MKLAQINAVMENAPKGANIVLEWVRPCKTRKAFRGRNIEKAVRMVGRLGVEYDNLKSVQAKRSDGRLPKENQGATWWEWERHPFLACHKKSGQRYLRMYKGTSEKVKPHRQFYLDGKAVDAETVAPMLLASETKSHDDTDTFMVKIEDLTAIRSENEDFAKVI